MYLETLIQELLDYGEKSDKVYISTYACGREHEEPFERVRLVFQDGKVVIDATDN
jgi:hypothetical protein